MEKTIREYEVEQGLVLRGEVDESEKVSADAFGKLLNERGFIGVNHDDRGKFLRDNGYPVTRETMVDSSLSTKPK